ncbi:NnrS family protein [Neptuniibacter sp. QD37_6]|uniref:NnrS family protein n=1 Tax=Neptuniibacter sp. QD37_6 TaxID=3398210 RepID=UPI0039F54E74
MIQLQERRTPSPFSLFNLAFRPFFLGGALSAILLMAAWLVIYSGGIQPHHYNYGVFWHAHEMLFGFSLAIIAGFLMTAVKTWTNVQTLYSWPLAALFLLWFSARLMPLFPAIEPWLVAVTDLAFAPMVAACVAWPVIKSKNYRNLMFVPLLLGFFIANLLMHLQLLGYTETTAAKGIQLGLFLVIMVISILGGRVIPFFTERGVEGVKVTKHAWLEKTIIPLTAVWVVLSLTGIEPLMIAISLLLGIANLIRVAGWFDKRIFAVPLVWILQFGYFFVALGFMLYSLSLLDLISTSIAYHAFAAGSIGGLTLGMMARVSLGHTGRPLKVGPLIITAFILMLLAAAVRLSIGLLPLSYLTTLHLSGTLWMLAWVLFLIIYTPILIKPRVDGLYG